MSTLIERLRVNIDAVRREGFMIDVNPPPRPPGTPPITTRPSYAPHLTAAAAEYKASDKAWGRLSEIALKHRTLPGSILKRINKYKR